MRTFRSGLVLVCALLLLLLQPLPTAAITPVGTVASRSEHPVVAAPVSEPGDVVHQGYDLILDRFVGPLQPGDLLAAAAEGALRHAAEVKPGEWPAPNLAFSGAREADWEVFAPWFRTLVALAAPEVEAAALERAALGAMAASVNERHTRYLSPSQYQDHLAWRRGDVRYAGVGVRLRGPTLTIVEVFEGSPAASVGLRPGDVIVAVDGVSTEGAPLDVSINRMRGPVGTTVELTVRRRGSSELASLTLKRDEIRIATVTSRVLDGSVGYIQLRGFPEAGVAEEVSRALDRFQEAGIRGLIMDLRGNAGGRVDVGIRVTSRFVREGVLFQYVDRAGQRRPTSAAGGYWEHAVPMVVLIDAGTASMGEIFAAALKEADAAHLIGAKTAGSVAAAQVYPLADGSALQVTVLEILSGQGDRLNGVGVDPHQVVEAAEEDFQLGLDRQLDAALAHLRDRAAPESASTPLPPGGLLDLPPAA